MLTSASVNHVYADFKPEYEAASLETDGLEYSFQCQLDFGSLDAPIALSSGSLYGWKGRSGRVIAQQNLIRRAGE